MMTLLIFIACVVIFPAIMIGSDVKSDRNGVRKHPFDWGAALLWVGLWVFIVLYFGS